MSEFGIRPISPERKSSIQSRTEWNTNSPVSLERLVEVHFLHYDFHGSEVAGQMIVLDVLGEDVLAIFQEMHEIKFPIESAIPVDEFDGDDVRSMDANNSSAFNARQIMNTDRWSSHAYGAAIDINPRQNPYVPNPHETNPNVYPTGGEHFLDRENIRSGMVDTIVPIFKKHGFTEWGGDWASPLDYHHFQLDWERIRGMIF